MIPRQAARWAAAAASLSRFSTCAALCGRSTWAQRQLKDPYRKSRISEGYVSRAAWKLVEMDAAFHIFRIGDTVVDLGYAPGAWSQVAVQRVGATREDGTGGRVVGVDVIPARPPDGMSALQGNFLAEATRREVKAFLADASKGRVRAPALRTDPQSEVQRAVVDALAAASAPASVGLSSAGTVDVVLSDMCAPLPLQTGWHSKSIVDPYIRMANATGHAGKDHYASMALCDEALTFAEDTLRRRGDGVRGGHFVCKALNGAGFAALEARMRTLFARVHRCKPLASRQDSRELYLVGLERV